MGRQNATIHKGTEIPNGCVVDANAFTNKRFSEPNAIIARTPTKVVKTNIYWDYNQDETSTQFVVND